MTARRCFSEARTTSSRACSMVSRDFDCGDLVLGARAGAGRWRSVGGEVGLVGLQAVDFVAERSLPALGNLHRAADRLELGLAGPLALLEARVLGDGRRPNRRLPVSVAGAAGQPSERTERRRGGRALKERGRIAIRISLSPSSLIMPDDRGVRKGWSSPDRAARRAKCATSWCGQVARPNEIRPLALFFRTGAMPSAPPITKTALDPPSPLR